MPEPSCIGLKSRGPSTRRGVALLQNRTRRKILLEESVRDDDRSGLASGRLSGADVSLRRRRLSSHPIDGGRASQRKVPGNRHPRGARLVASRLLSLAPTLTSLSLGRRFVHGAGVLVREQIEYRELFLQITKRDLLIRYKQTVMGFGWAVFMPLLNTIIFSLVFTRVAPVDTGMPYPVYAYLGLLAWNFFASSLRFSISSLTGNSNLVSKVYFPREIFPFSAVGVSLIDALVGASLLVLMLLYYGLAPGWSILLLPVVIATHVAITAAAGLLLAMANLFFRDVKYIFEIVLGVGMFATSVVYPVERMGGTLGAVLSLNPLTTIFNAYRAILIQQRWPEPAPLAVAAALALLTLGAAWMLFHRAELRFAENI
jgi:lipopolysaccharide transport system permease protein